MSKLISIVIPCHNEEKNIAPLAKELVKVIPKKYRYEIIFVDDGSKDKTYIEIFKLGRKNKHVKGISLHRNFGHQAALVAGTHYSKGNAIIMMDADFQHPPALLPKIINLWESGHDLIQMQKAQEKTTNAIKKIIRAFGYKTWQFVSGGVLIPGVSDFRLMDRQLVKYLLDSQEREIFLRGLTNLAANNSITIPYNVGKRKFGKSSYTVKMFINMFVNGFISFSTFPLRIASTIGLIMTVVSTTLLLGDVLLALITQRRIIQGFLTLVFLMIILNGFIIFYMGVLGEYLGVIFREVKKRPMYLIGKMINIK